MILILDNNGDPWNIRINRFRRLDNKGSHLGLGFVHMEKEINLFVLLFVFLMTD